MLLLPVADVQISPAIVLIIHHNGTGYSLKRPREHCLRSALPSLLFSFIFVSFIDNIIAANKIKWRSYKKVKLHYRILEKNFLGFYPVYIQYNSVSYCKVQLTCSWVNTGSKSLAKLATVVRWLTGNTLTLVRASIRVYPIRLGEFAIWSRPLDPSPSWKAMFQSRRERFLTVY